MNNGIYNCSNISTGIDLNRNYDFDFGQSSRGSSNYPCAEDYRGPFAFSELET